MYLFIVCLFFVVVVAIPLLIYHAFSIPCFGHRLAGEQVARFWGASSTG